MFKKKCVITGATGYIGSHLVHFLLLHEWDIYIISQPEFGYINIEDVKDSIHIIEYNNQMDVLIHFFKETNPDVVFHLAAAVIPDYKPDQVEVLIKSNILFGTEILEAMKHSTTRLFINTGSYWQNYNSDTYNPVDLYAATKEAFEKIFQFYVDSNGFRGITLRLFDVYGEDDKRPKLLNILKSIAGTDKSLDVSPGEQYLDLVHISDVCTAYLKAYELLISDIYQINEVYGVYTGERVQLKMLIHEFEKMMNKKINVNLGAKPYKKREVMNPTTYKKLINWNASLSWKNGIKRFKQSDL